jgi:hypothetical protein
MDLTRYQLNLLSALGTQHIRLSASLAPEAYAELKFLEKAGFVKIVPPDPNFSYLPDYNASDQFFALASPGWQALHLEQDRRQREIEEETKQQAERKADRANTDKDRKLHFAHEWKIAVYTSFTSFIAGAIANHFFDIVARAVEWWTSLLSHL